MDKDREQGLALLRYQKELEILRERLRAEQRQQRQQQPKGGKP